MGEEHGLSSLDKWIQGKVSVILLKWGMWVCNIESQVHHDDAAWDITVEKAINNSLRTRFEQFSLDFVIREVI